MFHISDNSTKFCAYFRVITAARLGLLPSDTKIDDPHLKQKICGIPFPNPVGLAAGEIINF